MEKAWNEKERRGKLGKIREGEHLEEIIFIGQDTSKEHQTPQYHCQALYGKRKGEER